MLPIFGAKSCQMWISRMALICGIKMKKKGNSKILNVRLPEFYSILPLMDVSNMTNICKLYDFEFNVDLIKLKT